jgi:hypothetical protein
VASARKTSGARKKPKAGRASAARGRYRTTLPNGNVKFGKALNDITGKTSLGNALPAFKALLTKEIRDVRRMRNRETSEEKLLEILQDNLDTWKDEGFSPEMVASYKAKYRALPRRRQHERGKIEK